MPKPTRMLQKDELGFPYLKPSPAQFVTLGITS
jgi:hypothetical protein